MRQHVIPSGRRRASVLVGCLLALPTSTGAGAASEDPTETPAGTFTAVSAGSWHTCAIRTDGTVVASLGGGQVDSIWLFDVWRGGEPRRIATLPATDVQEGGDPPSAPCLEWVPGGGS